MAHGELNFPFKTFLSFEYLIDFWKEAAVETHKIKSTITNHVLEKLKEAPELMEPITDCSVLKKYPDLIDVLMSVNYSPAKWDSQISASIVPFKFETFYSTPLYDKLINFDENSFERLKIDKNDMMRSKILKAYAFILKECYGAEIKTDHAMVVNIPDVEFGLDKYFKIEIDVSFLRVKTKGELIQLSEEQIKSLLQDATNLNLFLKLLPPENFEFYGFTTLNAFDVTEQEVLSALKFELLERESIISKERFRNLQKKLKSLFGLPELKIGLAAFPSRKQMKMDYGRKIGDSFILSDACSLSCSDFTGSIYHKAVESGEPYIVSDLRLYDEKGIVEQEIIKQGIINIAVAPLFYQNELVGVLELGSPNPAELTSFSLLKLKQVLSLFSIAVKRSLEELENTIQAIIKEKCTAIHPSVEWRFRNAASNLLQNREREQSSEMEPIVFDNVYPLYGLSDIRHSSDRRNEAIQTDLIEHLRMAKDIIDSANRIKPLPFLDEINYRISKHMNSLKVGLHSGDEISILDFLQNELESVFVHVGDLNSEMQSMINNYHAALDPELNIFYNKRKDYESSVALINDSITSYLDEAEEEAQGMFPHYFEKYKTDGVEHGIYIGASLVEDEKFDLLYLKNLRLWQLMVMCEVVRRTEKLKPKLKIPLDTAHLILVQNTPLSIRFRLDEKKFDVDGTYNIRYEIMKKRIDKAKVKGTNERLTQPHKIAIVYSQFKEASEYRRYIEYLLAQNYLTGKLEDLELEDLQGVQGLKALRVTVDMKSHAKKIDIGSKEIIKTVNKFGEIVS